MLQYVSIGVKGFDRPDDVTAKAAAEWWTGAGLGRPANAADGWCRGTKERSVFCVARWMWSMLCLVNCMSSVVSRVVLILRIFEMFMGDPLKTFQMVIKTPCEKYFHLILKFRGCSAISNFLIPALQSPMTFIASAAAANTGLRVAARRKR